MTKNMKLGLAIAAPVIAVTLGVLIYLSTYEAEIVEVEENFIVNVTNVELYDTFDGVSTLKVKEIEFTGLMDNLDDYTVIYKGEEVSRSRLDQLLNDNNTVENLTAFTEMNGKFNYEDTFSLSDYSGKMYAMDLLFMSDFQFKKVEEEYLIGKVVKKRTITTYKPKIVITESPIENQAYMPGDVITDANGNTYKIESFESYGAPYSTLNPDGEIQRVIEYAIELKVTSNVEELKLLLAHVRQDSEYICYNSVRGEALESELPSLEGTIVDGEAHGMLHVFCPVDLDFNNYQRVEAFIYTEQPTFVDVRVPMFFNLDKTIDTGK